MLKLFVGISLVFLISGCGVLSKQDILFKENTNNILKNTNIIPTHSTCTTYSYYSLSNTNKYGKVFVEYVDLDFNCHWYGDERGYFLYEFKSYMKLKSFELIESVKHDNYEFRTYKIDDSSYINFIFKYSVSKSIFMLDYDGLLTQELIKSFDINYTNEYINEKRFDIDYKNSLVRKNIFKSYFGRINESFLEN